MKHTPTQTALREMRDLLVNQKVWGGLGLATALLALSGPFGTIDDLGLVTRFGYWGLVAIITFFVGAFISEWLQFWCIARRMSRLAQVIIISSATGIAISIVVVVLNLVILGIPALELNYVFGLLINTFAISLLITSTIMLFSRKTDAPKQTRILSRLDLNKRGPIISLSVQDHYVEVVTSKGSSLILMRLSDAVNEVDNLDGLQVHRSHWVAKSHVAAVKRVGDKGVLTTSDGREIPISRTYIKTVRAAGLLPSQGNT